ncbi:MAG: pentapeptide repeat family protein [Rhizobium sp.]|nr:pentapeptide repeat family protein [Rhizobium sp.]
MKVQDTAIPGSEFDAVNLEYATFSNANLNGTCFEDVSMKHARFRNIDLSASRFEDINFEGTEITNCNLAGMKINGFLVTELLALANGKAGQISE